MQNEDANKNSLVKKWNKLFSINNNNASSTSTAKLKTTYEISELVQSSINGDVESNNENLIIQQLKYDSFLPKLTQRNFINRESKLNYIRQFVINDSKTNFTII